MRPLKSGGTRPRSGSSHPSPLSPAQLARFPALQRRNWERLACQARTCPDFQTVFRPRLRPRAAFGPIRVDSWNSYRVCQIITPCGRQPWLILGNDLSDPRLGQATSGVRV
jgi:hypothetical protein